MDIRYDDRVAIVTGAGAGLGRSHALFLAERGAKVVVNDLGGAIDGRGGSGTAADAVVDEIKAAGGEAVANYDSVDQAESAAAIIKTAEDAYGRVDILINNAGILRDKSFGKITMADFEAVMRVHLMGSVYCTHAAWPLMTEQGYGRIILTTSAAGLYGNFGQTNYAAAKLALVGFMNALKLEGQKNNILVNTIAPIAKTRMTEALIPEDFSKHLKPELVTPVVAWLVSEASQRTGDVVSAGAGYCALVKVEEARGVAFGSDEELTPETIRDRYDEIADMSAATDFLHANDLLAKVAKLING